MPVRSRFHLLAGMGAALALCTAGSGCQSSAVRQNAIALKPGPILSRPWFGFLHRQDSAPADAPVLARADGPGNPGRPAPPAATPAGTVASAWQPIQRVSGEQITAVSAPGPSRPPAVMSGTIRAAVDMPGRPVPIATASAVGEPVPPPKDLEMPPRLVPHPVVGAVVVHAPPLVPREFAKQPLPPYVIEPPDILLIQATPAITAGIQPVEGQHLVRPDGTIRIGVYGSVFVAGLTLDEAQDAVAAQLHTRLEKQTLEDIKKNLVVDVLAYNSKVYYVITDGGGYGEQVYSIPATGNETVLDAMSRINGLPAVASKKQIWVARATPHDVNNPEILPVDWCGITQRGSPATNYQIFPGDRVYVNSDPRIRTNSWLEKTLAPVEKLLGVTLLGSSTVNSIKNGGRTGTTTP